jgi:uncharacterized protein YbjT (DUF2867 family)
MYIFNKQRVAIIGATGQVGTPLTRGLLALGHDVVVLVRNLNCREQLNEYKAGGAEIVEVTNMLDVNAVASALSGSNTLVCAVPGSEQIISEHEAVWLEAAVKSGVKRFVPTEFGCHTRSLDYGDGILFDHKKKMHEKIFASGIGWTFFYTGGIFDYFLPNLRFFRKITTFGEMDLPIYTHEILDIGAVAAMALTDDRTLNRCVQMDYNVLTQTEMLDILSSSFPDYQFEYEHHSSEFITGARLNASNLVTTKKGNETDRERWGINYVIYVIGKLAGFTDETVRASELYPDYQVTKTPAQAIADLDFVFEK